MPFPLRPVFCLFQLTCLAMLLCAGDALAGEELRGPARIAVAANFAPALRALVEDFERRHGGRVGLVTGSTGKLYAQIRHGAPFDAMFAADARRPTLLEEEGRARPGSRFAYAIGRLVLWSSDPRRVDPQGRVLREGGFRHLAIANPGLAPYGLAARQALEALGLWSTLRPRLVRGENVGQALQFVRSGNAELGFVALSQVRRPGLAMAGSSWVVPEHLYAPIVQQAVRLTDHPQAVAFLDFVRSAEGRARIEAFGYRVP